MAVLPLRLRRIAAAVVVGIGLCGASAPAVLAEDGAPRISIGSTVRAAGGLTYTNVAIAWPGADGVRLTVAKIVVDGTVSDRNFEAREVTLTDLKLGSDQDPTSITVGNAVLKDVSGPILSSQSLAATLSAGHLPPILAWFLDLKASSIDIPALLIPDRSAAGNFALSVKDLHLGGIDTGKIAEIAIAGLADPTPSGGSGSGSCGAIKVEDLDLGAYAAWLDDDLAAQAPKDKRQAYASLSVSDFRAVDKADTVSFDRFTVSDVELGPPSIKPSQLFKTLGKMAKDPKFADHNPSEFVPFLRSVLGAYEFGALELGGFHNKSVTDPTVDIGLIRFEDFRGTSLGEFRIGDLSVDDPSDGTKMKLGSFAIRGLAVLELDALFDHVSSGQPAETLEVSKYPKPRVDAVAMEDVDFVQPGKPEIRIKAWTLDAPDWAGFFPTALKSRVDDLSMPIASLDDAQAVAAFGSLGIKDLSISSRTELAWSEADETVTLGPATTSIQGIGSIDTGLVLGGIPKTIFEHPDQALALLGGLEFDSALMSLVDGGGFEMIARNGERESGLSRTELAAQAVAGLHQSDLGKIASPQAMAEIEAAVKTFILFAKSFHLTVTAAQPLSLLALSGLGSDEAALEAVRKAIRIEVKANQ